MVDLALGQAVAEMQPAIRQRLCAAQYGVGIKAIAFEQAICPIGFEEGIMILQFPIFAGGRGDIEIAAGQGFGRCPMAVLRQGQSCCQQIDRFFGEVAVGCDLAAKNVEDRCTVPGFAEVKPIAARRGLGLTRSIVD